ncbi:MULTISPECIES: helix-turn-helix domain-containing protein [unclassified Mesorhizobium]|uniref:winged helix-turn-helix transcriptional regulator n=1 Tax=unclassified Mesorhizobium TaxID=325217 RepID=UPI001FEE840B|nr:MULTISPECIES: helix-turn-helix domain-containing protein [unclassified Mesorhizobium]
MLQSGHMAGQNLLPSPPGVAYDGGMAQRGRLYGCPVEFALDALGGKWKTVILARIKQGPLRYSELRRSIPSLSDKMLTQRLADLVEIGFVALEASPDGKGRYVLIERGRDLAAALEALYDWGNVHGRADGVRFRTDIETRQGA